MVGKSAGFIVAMILTRLRTSSSTSADIFLLSAVIINSIHSAYLEGMKYCCFRSNPPHYLYDEHYGACIRVSVGAPKMEQASIFSSLHQNVDGGQNGVLDRLVIQKDFVALYHL